jgi:hypothetical protein
MHILIVVLGLRSVYIIQGISSNEWQFDECLHPELCTQQGPPTLDFGDQVKPI